MSEMEIPDFMRAYLDKLDGDEAYPGMYQLAKEFHKDIERLHNNAGYYKDFKDLYNKKLIAIIQHYKEKALLHAKQHGLKEKEDEKEIKPLSKEEKLKQMVENHPKVEKETAKEQLAQNAHDITAKPIDSSLPPHSKTPPQEPKPTVPTPPDEDEERARIIAEIKAAQARNRQKERER
jgi:hypothetical protein